MLDLEPLLIFYITRSYDVSSSSEQFMLALYMHTTGTVRDSYSSVIVRIIGTLFEDFERYKMEFQCSCVQTDQK